jgi:hypothetical protein
VFGGAAKITGRYAARYGHRARGRFTALRGKQVFVAVIRAERAELRADFADMLAVA